MLIPTLSVLGVYAAVTSALIIRRTFKILDLHEEHQFVRSREQKGHIKIHAVTLRGGFHNDVKWVFQIPKKIKAAFDWVKTQQ